MITEINLPTSASETSRYALSVRREETTSFSADSVTDAVDAGAFLVGEATLSSVVARCVEDACLGFAVVDCFLVVVFLDVAVVDCFLVVVFLDVAVVFFVVVSTCLAAVSAPVELVL